MKKFPTRLLLILILYLHAPLFVSAEVQSAVSLEPLNTTDGHGLLTKSQASSGISDAPRQYDGLDLCNTNCVNPSDVVLGAVDGVAAFSNCQSNCIRSEFSFMNLRSNAISHYREDPNDSELHYVGLIYQCVEYARRWWMINLGITFGSIDSAYEIIYLTEGKDIHSGKEFSLSRSVNGTAKRAPKRGDLLIYYPTPDHPNWRYGHVAVITSVDHDRGLVSLAEQNYSNQRWQNETAYSRQIRLFKVGGRYQIIDVAETNHTNLGGGQVAGWVYPTLELD